MNFRISFVSRPFKSAVEILRFDAWDVLLVILTPILWVAGKLTLMFLEYQLGD